jgi:Icc protein
MKRRELIKKLGLATTLVGLTGFDSLLTAQAAPLINTAKRKLRIAHLTDVHIKPGILPERGFAKCLHHLQSLDSKPDIIFNGGDAIMDALGAEKDKVEKQWNIWNKLISNECSLKIEHCLGNHDVWGFKDSKDDVLWGKKYALEKTELLKPYRSFDLNGWHIIVLDSTHPRDDGSWYIAKLDEEQFDWLKNDLKENDEKPVLVLSHIPILSACTFFDGENEKSGNWNVPGSWMHIDARRITELFNKHKNVKLCISGHIHLQDRVDYNGVTYLCNGAVSGAWWGGKYQHTEPGYALIDLYDDGTFMHEYLTYR